MHDLIANSRATSLSCKYWCTAKKTGLLTLCLLTQLADAVDIRVGGEAGWTNTSHFDDVTAVVGDRLVFGPRILSSEYVFTLVLQRLRCIAGVRLGWRTSEERRNASEAQL